ncbi:hypothetical protein FOZ60_015077 [Perkinsus olseni]|uniref:V-type proton ATPase subunit G n=2 Tax=Perkinsus olseni TaxID=32597 RepID=A0A7J6N6P0_PEROL|nr:hypothetical protein FOZ60_015077 [Perkinsus olseni]KAF4715832.1 hypothetical protein FOZ62_026659 [Perkinsus olseni]
MASQQSQQLIQQLLKAEQEADTYVSRARENRTKKLREAKTAAQEEVASFRQKEEEKFNRDYAALQSTSGGEDKELAKQTQDDIDAIHTAYTKNSKATVKYMVDRVLDVTPELSRIQVDVLSM